MSSGQCPQRARPLPTFEGCLPCRADRDGVPGWAGHRPCRQADGEVVLGEPAGYRCPQRERLDGLLVAGGAQRGTGGPRPSRYVTYLDLVDDPTALTGAEAVFTAVPPRGLNRTDRDES
jgi:hypothetical protein